MFDIVNTDCNGNATSSRYVRSVINRNNAAALRVYIAARNIGVAKGTRLEQLYSVCVFIEGYRPIHHLAQCIYEISNFKFGNFLKAAKIVTHCYNSQSAVNAVNHLHSFNSIEQCLESSV